MYDKSNCLQIETTINDPTIFKVYGTVHHRDGTTSKQWKPMGKSISNLYRYAKIAKGSNKRYIDTLRNIIVPFHGDCNNRRVYIFPNIQSFHHATLVGNFSGETSLAAVGACGVLTLVFLAMANGFSAGAYVLIAQLFGAGEEKEMHRQALSSLLVMLGMKNERAASRQLLQPHHNKRVFGS